MRNIYSLLFLAGTQVGFSQNYNESFSGNNFIWQQSTSGLLFYDETNGMPGLEIPVGEGNHAVFAHALWLGGLLPNGDIRTTHQYFCQHTSSDNCIEKWGPLNDQANPNSPELAEQYNRIWFITRSEIEMHNAYFDCIQSPECNLEIEFPGGYEIPENFLSWPAMGPDLPGYATFLAPFVDYNADGFYDAAAGDHPNICGDFSTYIINNDVGTINTGEAFPALGIEIHTQVYGYEAESGALYNTLFVKHRIINRSNHTFLNTYLGTFTDFDLGNSMDDYIGTDVQRSMYYVYNGLNFDGPSPAGPGYGSNLPMAGIRYLGGPLKDQNNLDDPPYAPMFERYANQSTGWGDGIVDNERLGMFGSVYFTNVGAGTNMTSQASIPTELYDYLQGNWRDGVPRSYGGTGYDPDATILSPYHYFGNSDPLLVATGGVDPADTNQTGWTETSENNPFGDRRMIGSSGPFTFQPGQTTYFDYALVFARQSDDPNTELHTLFNSYADEIVGMECGALPQIVLSTRSLESNFHFDVYPNPANGIVNVNVADEGSAAYRLYDLTGKLIDSGTFGITRQTLSVSHLNSGIYFLHLTTASGTGVKKIVVQK